MNPLKYQLLNKGKELLLPAHLLLQSYTHKFQVEVNGQTVLFEPDEERNYRAFVDPEQMECKIKVELLKAIAEAIEEIT